MTNEQIKNSILDVVRACDTVQFCTINLDGYPETRDIANMMNRDATELVFYFMTSRSTPKVAQINKNPKCSLYCYDNATHHAMRLFGTVELIDDEQMRRQYWDDSFCQFGYSGVDDPEFILMRFTPREYKYYIAETIMTGSCC